MRLEAANSTENYSYVETVGIAARINSDANAIFYCLNKSNVFAGNLIPREMGYEFLRGNRDR